MRGERCAGSLCGVEGLLGCEAARVVLRKKEDGMRVM